MLPQKFSAATIRTLPPMVATVESAQPAAITARLTSTAMAGPLRVTPPTYHRNEN